MARYLVVITVMLSWLALVPLSAASQEATPAGTPAASATSLDLPSLSLTPQDLDAAGFPGYGLSTSTFAQGPDLVARTKFWQRLDETRMKGMVDQLESAGVERAYTAWLGKVDPASGEYQRDIILSIDEYADAAGAARGLELDTQIDREDQPDIQLLTESRRFGDGSQIVLYGGSGAEGSVPWLDMKIRLGTMNVGVGILEYTGQVPELADIEALADAALAKIGRERDAPPPGLSFHGLRLWPAVYSFDSYVRRDGASEPYAEEAPADRQAREARYGSAVDVYIVGQFLTPADTDESFDFNSVPRVQHLLSRFASEDAATAYLSEIPAILAADPSFADVAARETSADLGAESVALTYTASAPDGGTYYQDWVSSREGTLVSTIIVRTLGTPAPGAVVDGLAADAFACLHSDAWCAAVSAPADLLNVVPQATPAP